MNEQTHNPDELLSAEEAAARLKVSKKTIFKWAREGKIGSVRLSTRIIRFTEEQIAEFISRRTHEMRPEKTVRPSVRTPAPSPPLPRKSAKKQSKPTWKELMEEMRSWDKDEK